MSVEFKLEQFSGPLDLLLSLIRDRELNISDISLSNVTEQYLEHLDSMERTAPDELADFLLIASRLLFLKSKALLPKLLPEEDDGPSLAEQLRLYQLFSKASKKVHDMWHNPTRGVSRVQHILLSENPEPPQNMTTSTLHDFVLSLIKRNAAPDALPTAQIDKAITLKHKIDSFRTLLKRQKTVSFLKTLSDPKNKTERIVGFLAILELVKQKIVMLQQDALFKEITIKRV